MSAADPKPADRSSTIKLTPTSHLVLGMVRLGVSSGYAIKKTADASTQNFWPISLALVYPELARLEQGGLLRRRSDPRGSRARSVYTITAKGEKALVTWLRSPKVAPIQIRDEAMLKLFLADALGEEDQRALVAGLRERNRERRRVLEQQAVPRAAALEAQGIHYVAAAARFSADLLRYAEGWLGRLERRLEQDAGGGR
jgi:DNA-binding PadR family transcriptional regulator